MGIFSKKEGGERSVAVFDVSSGSVGGGIAEIHKGNNKTIPLTMLGAHRINLQLQHDLDIEKFVVQTVSALTKTAEILQRTSGKRPDYVQFVLASPWFVSQTRTIIHRQEEGFVFTEKLLEELVTREVNYVLEHDMAVFGSFAHDGKIIERQISMVKLNGYVSNEPFGKVAKEIEVYITLTITPEPILQKFKEAVMKHFHVKQYGFTTAPYALYVVHRDYLNPTNEATIIDVGEEVTDIAFIKDGLFLYQHSFPIGTYGLVRTLLDKKAMTLPEAESLLAAYRNDHLAIESKKKINDCIVTYKQLWQQGLQDIIKNGHFGFALPSKVLIVADPRYEILYREVIETDPLFTHLIASTKPQILFLTTEMLSAFVKGISADIPTQIGALFIDRQW